MAQLRRAIKDGHLYILAGQSLGTWQVSDKGEVWLRQHSYPIPEQNEFVNLDAGTFAYLRDKNYLYIHGIPYENNRQDISPGFQPEPVVQGLPLLLCLREQKTLTWELLIDLAELREDAWKELQNHPANLVTVSGALTAIPQKQLLRTPCYLTVFPRTQFYQVYREDNRSIKQVVKSIPEIPGLNSGWQGNVFIENPRQVGIWRRRLPNSAVSFWGELLWLARAEYKPEEWPSKADSLGMIHTGWQLWRLVVDENAPASWEAVQLWLSYRSIALVAQRQRLEIISPPTAITDAGQYIIQPDQQLLIACNPPSRLIQGIDKSLTLSAEQMNNVTSSHSTSSKVVSVPFSADQVSYFRWSADSPGEYRIRIQGDATSEPLFIQVQSLPLAQPKWLHGLSCTITSDRAQQTYYAFNDTPDIELQRSLHEQFTLSELPKLTWTYEPQNLPLEVTWNYVSSDRAEHTKSVNSFRSGEELTWYWQEHIWPAIVTGLSAKITLDPGSFGCIELSIAIFQPGQAEIAQWTDERLSAQFTWLSRMIVTKRNEKRIPMPASLRSTLRQLWARVDTKSSLRAALGRLAIADDIPAWILFRLQALVMEAENINAIDKS